MSGQASRRSSTSRGLGGQSGPRKAYTKRAGSQPMFRCQCMVLVVPGLPEQPCAALVFAHRRLDHLREMHGLSLIDVERGMKQFAQDDRREEKPGPKAAGDEADPTTCECGNEKHHRAIACPVCTMRDRAFERNDKVPQNQTWADYLKERRAVARANGTCTRCLVRPADKPKKSCAECRAVWAADTADARARKKGEPDE